MENKIRIAVVGDQPLFREGVIHSLAMQDDMTIVGQGLRTEDALRIARESFPDVIVLDLNPSCDPVGAIETLAVKQPKVSVILITEVTDAVCVAAAMRRGARGYLLKSVGASELVATVRLLSQGEHYVSVSLATQLLRALYTEPVAETPLLTRFDTLTSREQEILTLLSRALSNKEIALKLVLTEKTVKHYLTSILKKLNARNRVEAALLESQRGPVLEARVAPPNLLPAPLRRLAHG